MSIKRRKDPAGLLPDQVTIDLVDFDPDDLDTLRDMFHAASPQGRVERLRRHDSLVATADEIEGRLCELGGIMNGETEILLLHTESKALYLDAAPSAMEKKNRQRGASALNDKDIDLALKQNKTRVEAASALGITARQLRNRINSSDFLKSRWKIRSRGNS